MTRSAKPGLSGVPTLRPCRCRTLKTVSILFASTIALVAISNLLLWNVDGGIPIQLQQEMPTEAAVVSTVTQKLLPVLLQHHAREAEDATATAAAAAAAAAAAPPSVLRLLLGLGLAKTGSTSLLKTMCEQKLLVFSRCDAGVPEDKYWHRCVNDNFQPAAHPVDDEAATTTAVHRYNTSAIAAYFAAQRPGNGSGSSSCSFEDWIATTYSRHWRQSPSSAVAAAAADADADNMNINTYHAKTTNHFGSVYIPHLLHSLLAAHRLTTKFYVLFRRPLDRIVSSYIFMVGHEKKLLPDRFGSVSKFIQRDVRDSPELRRMVGVLRTGMDGGEKEIGTATGIGTETGTVWSLDWKSILGSFVGYEAKTRRQCYLDKQYIAQHHRGPPPGFTCERDVFRATVADSCYVLPLMMWMTEFGREFMKANFRVIQSELLFDGDARMQVYIDSLLCYAGDYAKCASGDSQRDGAAAASKMGKVRVDASTSKYQNNADHPEFQVDADVLAEMERMFEPCGYWLRQLLVEEMPELMLVEPFQLELWKKKKN